MAGKTISEKILSAKSQKDVRAGDLAVCRIDCALGTDGSTPMALEYFERMGGNRVFDPDRIVFVMDHYCAPPPAPTAALQERMRTFATQFGISTYDVGEGICHQLMVESGHAAPGRLIVGADSHTVTAGALNAFATGIGSSDLAAAMICGRMWLRVPQTIKVILEGRLPAHVYAKDVALELARLLGADGAAYQALEFHGDGAAELDLEERAVLSNMSVETGAKAGIFPADAKTLAYVAGRARETPLPVDADADARYSRGIALDLSSLSPRVAKPHAVDNVDALENVLGTPVRMIFLGTCTGGRVRDFHIACGILEAAGRIAPGVLVVVTPASRKIEAELRRDGTLARFAALGAVITPPGCGSCCGTAGPVPGDGVNVMSTANRNFKARMGQPGASIYLASPASCAAAAATGRITDPRAFAGALK